MALDLSVVVMRLGYEEKPDHPKPEARWGKVPAVLLVLVLTALFAALLKLAVGL